MNLYRILPVLMGVLIWAACSEDDQGNVTAPFLEITSENSVKPDSSISMEIAATAAGLLAMDAITGEIVSGEGTLTKTGFQGENQATGSATFDFIAGSTENTSTLLKFSVIDQSGQTGVAEIEIDITSLDVKQVLVLNEGNFLSANGSVDVFDITQNEINQNVYSASATLQHAVYYNDKFYLVTNAPDRLVILDNQLSLIADIDQGLDNPIDFAAVGNTGYVSNWGDINTAFSDEPDSYVAMVDLETNTVTSTVPLAVRPQSILAHNDLVYIANEGGSTVSVLNPNDLSITDVTVAQGPSEMAVDENGSIWVLCTSGALVEIDPDNLSVGSTIDGLVTSGFGEKMDIDGSGTAIYFLGGTNNTFTGLTTVYKVDLNSRLVTPFMENGFALYGIGINPESNEVYVGDSNAFQSTGTGFRYSSSGVKLGEFATGIGPKEFVFY